MPSRVRCAARRARRGFTLLEGVAALVVIGLASAAALGALGSELRTAGRVRHAAEAEALARQRLATLRLLPREALRRLPDSLARGAYSPPLDAYRWRATASAVRPEDDLYELRVDVTWAGGAYALATRQYRPPEAGLRR